MTTARTVVDPASEQLQRRLARAAAKARRALGRPDDSRLPDAGELAGMIGALEQQLASAGEPEGLKDAADAHAAELERLRQRYQTRFDALADIEAAVGRLREITSPAGMLGRAPTELCASSQLRRSVLSLVRDGLMVAKAAHFQGDAAGATGALEALGVDPPRLEHPLIETELMRRRRATIVTDARSHPRVHQPSARVLRWDSYVAAPLVVRGEVIGLIHADVAGADRALDVLDGDVLWVFARGLADAYETASLRRSIRRQRDEMRQFVEWLSVESSQLSDDPIDLAPRAGPSEPPGKLDVVSGGPGVDDRAVFQDLLTRRELDVLRLLARGEPNRRIAAQLVISEATVKSHVVNLLRKLRVSNRAQAVSRYHRLVRPRADGG